MRTAPFATCLAALAAATPAQATFPGANGKIAFESYSGLPSTINVVNPDGSGETELTRGMQDRDPAWSPDGTRIAFTRYADGDAEIWVMNPDGTNQTKLTSNTAHDSEPTWTGNGIAFESWRDFGNREIYLMNTDGSSQRSLTRTEAGPYESAPSAKLGTIAYTREVIVENDIWKLSGPNLDVQAPVLSDGIDANWSPDGNRLAFARPVSRPDLWVAREDGSFQVNITNTDLPLVHETDPSWAPSGDWIVYGVDYFVDSNAERDIWITDPDGEVRRPLVTGKGISERDPDWQPLPREAGQYPRPKGATPIRASLVPAAKPCTAPNRSHGPPLAFDACAPPVPESPNLTAGSALEALLRRSPPAP